MVSTLANLIETSSELVEDHIVENLLPCERHFSENHKKNSNEWLKLVQKEYGAPIRKFHPEVLKGTKNHSIKIKGRQALKIGLPEFALIDPHLPSINPTDEYYGNDLQRRGGITVEITSDRDRESKVDTSHHPLNTVDVKVKENWLLNDDMSTVANFITGTIILAVSAIAVFSIFKFCDETPLRVLVSCIAGIASIFGGLFAIPSVVNLHKNTFVKNERCKLHFSTMLPGLIPPDAKKKIEKATKVAKNVGGELYLIVEADWKVSRVERTIIPENKDPIIVIVKGDTIAYIDRFDCTTKENLIAQGHTTPV